jgi:hypothetical protein
MKNLNGWMRLWILLSGLWIMFFTAIFFNDLLGEQYAPEWSIAGNLSTEVSKALSTESERNAISIEVEGMPDKILLKPDTSEALVAQAKAEFQKLAKEQASLIWWHKFQDYLTLVLSFPILSYLLARALHWVWLGFKRSAE